MNFFGHAVISRHVSLPGGGEHAGTAASAAHAAHALGAMLPDFASMCGARLAGSSDPQIAAGIELHHRTDAVFHQLPPVLALMRGLEERLRTAGCSRGPTRAVSHLGVELLLDGVFVQDRDARRLYLDAVALPAAGLAASLHWREADHPDRFATLQARLHTHGVPDDLQRAPSVTERLLRVISRRPLLAPRGSDAAIVAAAITAYQGRVTAAADAILRGVLAGLPA